MLRPIFTALLLATPALAADLVKGGPPGTNVDMPFLMAPMTGNDGKLSGYAYLSPRLTADSAASALEVRNKLAFIQDAFIRDINGRPVTQANDPGSVDLAGVELRLANDARRVIGAASVKMVTICTVQISDLHPKATQSADGAGAPPPESRCEPEKTGG
jgi:hypothetical protein